MMRDLYMGKLYKWSGADFSWANTTTYEYVTRNAAGTGIEDNSTVGPAQDSAADWILSDDLIDIGAKTASIRIKATKTAGAAYTAGTHNCNGFAVLDSEELASTVTVGSGSTPLWMTCVGAAAAGSVVIPTYLTSAASTKVAYTHVHFFSNALCRRVEPIRVIAITLPLQSGAGAVAGHTYQFEVQWYYTR